MSKISDEIRKVADEYDVLPLYKLADRMDREMVELPLSADRKIWTGREECFWVEARGGTWERHSLRSLDIVNGSRWYVRDTGGLGYEAGAAWHARPDSLERIADDIEESKGTVLISEKTLNEWAERIRKLAEKEGEQ